jgi:hypothetical protein
MTEESNATKPPEETSEISEEQKLKIKEAAEKFQKHIEEKLKECEYKALDNERYAFMFENKRFVFHTPNLLEKTRIKAICSEITNFPGSLNHFGASFKIESSGDSDLICSTRLLTHTAVLMEEPVKFNPKDYDDDQQFELGYRIFTSENHFYSEKKKASTNEQ